jgi:hypothetical protein
MRCDRTARVAAKQQYGNVRSPGHMQLLEKSLDCCRTHVQCRLALYRLNVENRLHGLQRRKIRFCFFSLMSAVACAVNIL